MILAASALAWLLGKILQKPVLRLLALIIGAGLFFLVAVGLYDHGLIIPVFSPMFSLLGAGFLFSAIEQVLDRVEKQRFRSTLERYVSRDIVRELLDNRDSFLNVLGGARKEITLLFSDVRGFTTLTESADAQQLVLQLNEYFNAMVGIVFAEHGTLDKFIGDAVMAHWGGIVTEGKERDACHAVSTGLAMRSALTRLNVGWKQRGMTELQFGIGINHGEAIVGNLGCEAKMEVSAIGDCVNTASRLEGATKEYHLDLLIGASVAELVREKFVLRSVDLLQVKGKTRPIEVFTVLRARNGASADEEWLVTYEEGIRLFRGRDFAAAAAKFERAATMRPADWLNDEYVRRSRFYAAEPPDSEWDGVYVMTKK
jgi:adenylate cyclase